MVGAAYNNNLLKSLHLARYRGACSPHVNHARKDPRTKPGGDNSYAFTAELGKDETLSWAGTVSLEPIQSSGKFSLSGVKLHGLWQYLHDRFRFDVIDGTVAADGTYTFDASATPIELNCHPRTSESKSLQSGRMGISTRRLRFQC